ncbi:MAG: hypothetical protein KKC79_00860 [Gammaproteobacteria bacterium]|nr:hypothetical protein [Gammaproteobacteria bacterium]MBU2407180.1 hypothetical protein [Gammaproteobacteria bacterium]
MRAGLKRAFASACASIAVASSLAVSPGAFARNSSAETTAAQRSEVRSCLLHQNPRARPDCASYDAFFEAVDADCQRWEGFEAYLSSETREEDSGAGAVIHRYRFGCRDTRLEGNSGWEGGLLSVATSLNCPIQGSRLEIRTQSCILAPPKTRRASASKPSVPMRLRQL